MNSDKFQFVEVHPPYDKICTPLRKFYPNMISFPLIRLQRKISGALYLQRTRAIPGDAGILQTPAITDTDPHGSCSDPKK